MNTSTNSQKGNLIFDDGAFLEAMRNGIRPDPHYLVAGWADRHRVLDTRSSSEAGQWRTSRTPYLEEPMNCLSADSPIHKVVMQAGAQIGKTETGNNWIGYVIDHVPGPMLAVQPTVAMAKRFSQQRLDPLIMASSKLREKVPPARQRDSGNTALSKEFPGGILVLTGANSATSLRSMPARYLFLDEVDAYPGDIEGEGDPVALAEARTRTFGRRRKVLITSTPTIKGMSRIEREFDMTDQRRYFVPCPHCHELQALQFDRLRWTWGKPETVHYICEHNGCVIEEHHKPFMLAKRNGAEWRPMAVAEQPGVRGYHISSLYSPLGWLSWEQIATEWEAAQGSDDAIKAFKNGVLGETWTETGDAPDWKRLYDRREDYTRTRVPGGVVFLTAGVDVQKNRLEISVYGWGKGLQSWLIDHRILDGGSDDPATWAQLTELMNEPFEREDGMQFSIKRLAVDTGFETQVVYSWARKQSSPVVMPVKGEETFNRTQPVAGPTIVDVTDGGRKIRRGARLWRVAVSTFKSETYRWLRLEKPTDEEIANDGFPAGYIHIPLGIDGEWFKQLTAEQLVTRKDRRGFSRYEWQKLRERNEALDCRVYARAAAYAMGADFWSENTWDRMARAVGTFADNDTMSQEMPNQPRIRPDKRRRRKQAVRPSR